jgi:hypothetical protein
MTGELPSVQLLQTFLGAAAVGGLRQLMFIMGLLLGLGEYDNEQTHLLVVRHVHC